MIFLFVLVLVLLFAIRMSNQAEQKISEHKTLERKETRRLNPILSTISHFNNDYWTICEALQKIFDELLILRRFKWMEWLKLNIIAKVVEVILKFINNLWSTSLFAIT